MKKNNAVIKKLLYLRNYYCDEASVLYYKNCFDMHTGFALVSSSVFGICMAIQEKRTESVKTNQINLEFQNLYKLNSLRL